jgi:hypothetical protein
MPVGRVGHFEVRENSIIFRGSRRSGLLGARPSPWSAHWAELIRQMGERLLRLGPGRRLGPLESDNGPGGGRPRGAGTLARLSRRTR